MAALHILPHLVIIMTERYPRVLCILQMTAWEVRLLAQVHT